MNVFAENQLIFAALMTALGSAGGDVDQSYFNGPEFTPPAVATPSSTAKWWRPRLDPDSTTRPLGLSSTSPSERTGALVIQHFSPLAGGLAQSLTAWAIVIAAFHRAQLVSSDKKVVVNFGDAPNPRAATAPKAAFFQTNLTIRYTVQDIP